MVPQAPHLVTDEVPLLLVVVLAQEPGFVRGQVHRALGADGGVSPWGTWGRCSPKATQSHGTARVPLEGTQHHGTARVPTRAPGPMARPVSLASASRATGPHAWHRDGSATSATCQPPAAPNLPSAEASFLSAPASSPANHSLRSPTAARGPAPCPARRDASHRQGGCRGPRGQDAAQGTGVTKDTSGMPRWKAGMPDGHRLGAAPAGDATPGGRCHPWQCC